MSPLITLIVYLGSIIFACYLVGAAIYLWTYRSFFSNYIDSTNSSSQDWNKRFWGKDIEKMRGESLRMMIAVIIMGLVCAIALGLIGWVAYNFMRNFLQTKKITLLAAIIAIGLFAFLSAVYFLNDKRRWDYIKQYLSNTKNLNVMPVLFYFALIAIGLAFLNAIFSLIGSLFGQKWGKAYHFIFGFIFLFLGALALIFVTILLKNVYTFTSVKPMTCKQCADIAHESEYQSGWSEFCTGKYLPKDQTCRKQDFYMRWESKPEELRSLNPSCCFVSSDIVIWPYFILGILVVFLSLSMLVAAASNIAIANSNKYDEEVYNSLQIIDYITIACIAILGIILIFYLIFRPSPQFSNRYSNGYQGFDVDDHGNLTPKRSFAKVEDYVVKDEPSQ